VQADSLAAQGAAASSKWVEYQIAHEKNNESKPPEPFTLGPGQKRFDAQGKEIAVGGPREIAPTWKPVHNKNSPTGLSYQDLNTGKIGGPAPAPQMQQSKEYKQYVGTTPDGGNAIVFDARAGKFTTEPLPGGELPGVKGKKALPASEASTLAQLKTTHQDIQLTREAWDEGLTGAFQGRANEALQGVRNHPAFEKLRRRVAKLITVAYALSGKQISKEELELLQTTILPQVKQMDQNFLVALDELDNWITRNGRNKEEAFGKAYYQFEPIFGGGAAASSPAKPRFEIIGVK